MRRVSGFRVAKISFMTAFAAAFCAACTSVPSTSARADRAAPGDPAAAAVERCRSSDLSEERGCYEELLLARIRDGGAGPALALLDGIAALDRDVLREGHMYAHGIGISALRAPEDVARVFASCTPGYQSGCYHGVIQSYFLAVQRGGGAVTTETLDALCADYRGSADRTALHFQCVHGLGHGLAILHGRDLPRALTSCDLLSRPEEREHCYGGAFMENIVAATHPEHAAADHADHAAAGPAAHSGAGDHGDGAHGDGDHGRHAGAEPPAEPSAEGDHGHHDHGPAPSPSPAGTQDTEAADHAHHDSAATAASAAAPFKALDPDDLHYPCSIMAEKYVNACYTIQTAAMLHHNGYDYERAAVECGRAPERARNTCFVSLGRDISGVATLDPERAVRLCAHAPATFQATCNAAVVESLVNVRGDPATGLAYCRLVAADSGKGACYGAVGGQASLAGGVARRIEACRGAEEGFREICRGGIPDPSEPAATEAGAASTS